jgi:hypothetical protein
MVMLLWDKIPEPTLALRLHNMLIKKGYLKKRVGLYATLENPFPDSFISDGVLTEGFSKALVARNVQEHSAFYATAKM